MGVEQTGLKLIFEQAYLRTSYHVRLADGGEVVIRIGQPSAELDRLLTDSGAGQWTFLSACNPQSEPLSSNQNAERMRHLKADLERASWRFWEGEGVGEDGRWAPEPSFFVVGISRSEAMRLASKYGQNAFVFGEAGCEAEMLWVAEGP